MCVRIHEGFSVKVVHTELQGLQIVELKIHGDSRGFFVERFNESVFRDLDLPLHFVQDNHSRSAPGILRGLHYQVNPAQGKLVGVVRGRIWDVAVDIRSDSPTFGKSFGIELSDLNGRLLWVPGGFAHGFCVIGDEPADVFYKVTTLYNPQLEGGILWDDPDLKIQWPMAAPQVSIRDMHLQSFAHYQLKPAF